MDVIQFLYTLPGVPLGYLLYFIYKFLCSNVGIAILIFTFIVKVAMLPIYIKQQKSQAKSSVFMPMVQEIQKKYANNREKQQEELMKLQQMGYKPTAGCGSMLLSLLILFGVIDVVYKPLTHIVHMSSARITSVVEESYNVEFATLISEQAVMTESELAELSEDALKKHDSIMNDAQKLVDYYNAHCLKDDKKEISISIFSELNPDTVKMLKETMKSAMLNEFSQNEKATLFTDTDLVVISSAEKEELDALETDEEKEKYRAEHAFGSYTTNLLNTMRMHYGAYKVASEDSVTFAATSAMQRELYALERFGSEFGPENNKIKCSSMYTSINSETKEELLELYDNLNFVGIKLGQVPKDNMGFPMILVPIISFIMAFAQAVISNKITAKTNPQQAQMAGMGPMKILMYVMPLFSLWIAFTVPAGAGFYWTISYAFGIVQTLVLNKLYNPVVLREQAAAEWEAMNGKSKKEKTVNVEAVKVVDENGNEETISQKELNRRKLAAARKAQAEKYGEEYHDDDDD